MMRKLLTFLKVVIIFAFMAGCGETGKEVNPEVTPEIKLPEGVQSSEVSIKSDSQSFTVAFSSNVPWTATVSADWIFISPSSGQAGSKTISIKVMENTTDQPRTAYVTISDKDGQAKLSFVINQEAMARKLALNPESMTFSAQGGEDNLTVSSNTDWTASKDADWITLNSDKGSGDFSLKVIVNENYGLTARTGSITVTTADGRINGTVAVQQAGADVVFSIDRQEVSANADGEDFTVNVTHNIGYKINSMPDWVKQTNKATSGNTDTYTFKAEANASTAAREGVIVFCNDNNECVPVTVKQAGTNTTLSVSPTSITFTAKSESKTFTVTSNTDWTATSDADWAKLSATGGNGNAQVTVTAEENTATKQRIAAITLKTKDGKTTATIKLSQNGADIIFRTDGDNREYEIGAEGGEIQFFVIHNIECYLKEIPEWVILDNMQTYDGATWYKFIIIPNTSTSERGGHIVIRGLAENEYDLPILVIQAAGKPKGGNENTTTGEEITIE